MTTDQKKVAIGAASGVVLMAVSVTALYHLLPTISGITTPLDALFFTLRMNVFALLPLFVGIITIGNERFFSSAIDPLLHAENTTMEINGRVVENTLQQQFVFFGGTLALSTFLTGESIKLIVALTIVYVLARIAFWIGYHIHPLYRAPGMAGTAYLNLGILLTVLYLFLF